MREQIASARPRLDPVYAQLLLASVLCAGLGLVAMTAGAQVSSHVKEAAPAVTARPAPPASSPATPPESTQPTAAAVAVPPSSTPRQSTAATPPEGERDVIVAPVRRVRPVAQPTRGASTPAKTAQSRKAKAAPAPAKAPVKITSARR